MATGDGLLARLTPLAPIAIEAWLALCAAGERQGNGIIEVTQRANLQFRGLSAASAPPFAREVLALGLGVEERPAILAPALLGRAPGEPAGLRELVAGLRHELPAAVAGMTLGPKVSVIVDGDTALHLDGLAADVRLQLVDDAQAHLAIGGSAASCSSVGWIEPRHAPEAIIAALAMIAQRGLSARARDIANDADLRLLRARLPGAFSDAPPPMPRLSAEYLGIHALNNGLVALGVAPAFGYAHAGMLQAFAEAAARGGAESIQPAPGACLLAIGLQRSDAEALTDTAQALGFIVQPDDPRRFVYACAGAPACGSALLDTRALAPRIAQAAAQRLDLATSIHVSGCAKGCAHPGAAALTFVGPGAVVVNGRAGDEPQVHASAEAFIAALAILEVPTDYCALPALIRERGRA